MAPLRIACFGDSLTEGFGLHDSQALPAVLEQRLREQDLDVRCLNLGISGETTEDGLDRLDQLLDARPDLAVIQFGTNDFFVGLEPSETELNLTDMLEALADKNIRTVLVGVCCLAEFGEEYKAEFDAVFPRLADRFGVPLLPDLLAAYLHDPSLLLIDQLHPNTAGVRAMVEALAPLVIKALEGVRSR